MPYVIVLDTTGSTTYARQQTRNTEKREKKKRKTTETRQDLDETYTTVDRAMSVARKPGPGTLYNCSNIDVRLSRKHILWDGCPVPGRVWRHTEADCMAPSTPLSGVSKKKTSQE